MVGSGSGTTIVDCGSISSAEVGMSVSTNAIAVNRGSIIGTGWVTMWADSSIINYDNIRTATQGMHASTDSYAINHGAIVTTGSDDKEMQAHVRSNIANGGGGYYHRKQPRYVCI